MDRHIVEERLLSFCMRGGAGRDVLGEPEILEKERKVVRDEAMSTGTYDEIRRKSGFSDTVIFLLEVWKSFKRGGLMACVIRDSVEPKKVELHRYCGVASPKKCGKESQADLIQET